MFKPVLMNDRLLGHALDVNGAHFFFGAGQTTREDLIARYPELEFCFVRQVHGRTVVTANPVNSEEADAHVTTRERRAPVIVTADCVPVLLASRDRACAIHAGWRGVEANVVSAALAQFPAEDPVLVAAIGPHLSAASFEIGLDVAARLRAVAPADLTTLERAHADPAKVYFDLAALVHAQLRPAPRAQIFSFTPDTLTNPAYHSYRRNPGAGGRNLSFVVRNP